MTDGCPTCGESFDNDDFGTDGNGYLILIHVCRGAAIARIGQTFPKYEPTKRPAVCKDCQRPCEGTRCYPCRLVREANAKRNRAAAMAVARERKCVTCPRFATTWSDYCRRCQRDQRIRRGLQQYAL